MHDASPYFGGGYSRAEYLKKKHYFKSIGEHVYLQPWNFVNHDITCMMFNYMDKEHHYKIRQGEINIGNNVFIGAGSRILYDVMIGDNVIIGAGSLVNKDIPNGTVAAGVPCKVIGSFDEYMSRLREK